MDEWINYDQFDRQTWHSFFPSEITFLTQENLDEIKSLNDQISLRDVQDASPRAGFRTSSGSPVR